MARWVFVNGALDAQLSAMAELPSGLTVQSFGERVDADAAWLAAGEAERALTALNAALTAGGAVIDVAAGAEIASMVQLVFVTTGEPTVLASPRNVVRVGDGAVPADG